MAGTFSFPDDVPTLSDGEVTLRAHSLSDVDEVVVQCTDPASIRWTTVPEPYDRALAVEYVTTGVAEAWRQHKDLNFAIETTHADGRRKFSGSVSLRPMEKGIAELAFDLHPGVRGRGVCRRAVKLILDWGFQQPDIDVIVWYAYVGNWGSRRVAWANGFSFDGTVTKYLPHRGERMDSWCGSLRADDTREPKHDWNVPPVLESDRLRLRQLRESDAERIGQALTDERTRFYVGTAPLAKISGPAFVLHQLSGDAKGDRVNWCIADRGDDRFLGHIQLFGFTGLDRTAAEVGYFVHPDARGAGVLTESLTMVTEWAFRRTEDGGFGKRRLFLGTAATNTASCHGAEKAGFVRIASLPETFPTEEGFVDEAIYHQLNPLWRPESEGGPDDRA